MRPWVKWLVNHNMKFVVYLLWLVVLPMFSLVYAGEAAKDALYELNGIHNLKKD